jgi:transposase
MYQKFPDSDFNNDVTSPDRLSLRRGTTDQVNQPWAFREFRGLRLCMAYFTNKSYKKCVEVFQARFPDSVKPSKSNVYDLIKRFRETGGVNDRKRSGRPGTVTPAFVEDVKEHLPRLT